MRKSKVIITSLLMTFGVSLLVGGVSASWAVTDDATSFSLTISTAEIPEPVINKAYLNPVDNLWGQDLYSGRNIYFTNSSNWSGDIYAYLFNSKTDQNDGTAWPGHKMTYVEQNEYDQSVYVYNVPNTDYDTIIFNNNSNQTVNIPFGEAVDGTGYYDYWEEETPGNWVHKYGEFEYAPVRNKTPLYYAWVWEDDKDGSWRALSASETKAGYYEIELEENETNIIFARFASAPADATEFGDDYINKTSDLKVQGDGYVYTMSSMSAGSWSKVE